MVNKSSRLWRIISVHQSVIDIPALQPCQVSAKFQQQLRLCGIPPTIHRCALCSGFIIAIVGNPRERKPAPLCNLLKLFKNRDSDSYPPKSVTPIHYNLRLLFTIISDSYSPESQTPIHLNLDLMYSIILGLLFTLFWDSCSP